MRWSRCLSRGQRASWLRQLEQSNRACGRGMTCQQLKNEKRRIATRQTDLAPSLVPAEDEQKREQELSQLSGR